MTRAFFMAFICFLLAGTVEGAAQDKSNPPNIASIASASTKPDGRTSLSRFALAKEMLRHSQSSSDLAFALAALRLASATLPTPALAEFEATARDLAYGDTAATALIDAMLAEATRGPVVALKEPISRTVPADGRVFIDTDLLTFEGQERAEISLTGSGRSDLDLIVRDDAGNEICRAEGPSDFEFCSWIPRRTGLFRVEVINHGSRDNAFDLRTN